MDKQSTVGFILIALVLMVWMWYNTPPPRKPTAADSLAMAQYDSMKLKEAEAQKGQPPASLSSSGQQENQSEGYGEFFSARAVGTERILTVSTELYTAEITTKGGLVRKWELKNYKTWNQYPVQLVDLEKGGDLSLLFLTEDGKQINTKGLFFEANLPVGNKAELKGDETLTIELVLPVGDRKRIIKQLKFTGNTYTFDAEFVFENVNDVVSGFEYQVLWENPLPYAEQNSIDESGFAQAFAFSGGEVADIDAPSESEPASKDLNGATDWVAARNKYFAVAMIPAPGTSQGAVIEGYAKTQPDRGIKENYSLAVKMPFKAESKESSKFRVFLGPLDYSLVKAMGNGLDRIMSLGAVWIIRPITEYVLMPLFNFLHLFIANWGIVIIVFSIIIKIALHPLTKKQMDSMRKMSKLTPMMNEIRDKYPDDPQKVNSEMMKLYRDYGINPAGGCLPLLLQMPILYALYNVFASTIQLRQSSFFGWINDLSIPDSIMRLPFTLPLFGINQISGLALGMCITMFIQQKQAVTDPRQKAMIYMMPIMMMLIFNNLPSGLNLYYFVFNLLSIAQQWWTNKKHGDEPLRKVDPKKAQGGLIGKLAKNLPELQKMQQRR